MGYDIDKGITIDAPPAAVWHWTVQDPHKEQQWRNLNGNGVQEVQRVGGGPVEVGSRFRGTVKVGPGSAESYLNEITDIDKHRRISWTTIEADGPLGGQGSYLFTPLDDATRTHFRIQLDYEPLTLAGRIQRPIITVIGRLYFIPRMLEKLKGLVEAGSGKQ